MRAVLSRYLLWALLALPAVAIMYGYLNGTMIYGEVVHVSGETGARLLILTMAVTPLRLMFPGARWPLWLLQRRRYLGVAAFAYALLHAVVYMQKSGTAARILADAAEPGMWIGWLGLLIMLPLAMTSNDASVRRLKRAWKSLHRWVYLAALASFVHWILVAFDPVGGAVHLGILAALEAYRVWKSSRPAAAAREPEGPRSRETPGA